MEFETLEQVQAALEAEQEEWNRLGLNLGNVQIGALPPMLIDLSSKVQALTNCILMCDEISISEEDINFQYKLIVLNNMIALRESAPQQERDQIRRQILDGARMRINNKPPWEN